MNLQNLQYVEEVIKCGSISAAARKLYISQPYLSKILMEVEREYGITIFSRVKNTLTLTESGAAFSAALRTLLGTIDNFDHSLRQLGSQVSLSFSSCHTAWISEAYLSFFKAHQDVRLRVNYHEGDNSAVINDVYTLASEFGFIILPGDEFAFAEGLLNSMNICCERMIDFEVYLGARIGHPLSRLSHPVRFEDIYPYGLVLYTQHYPMKANQVGTAQYEYKFSQIDWNRFRHITYVQSRAQYYDLLRHTDCVGFGFQPYAAQEAHGHILSLRVDPTFIDAFGRDVRSTLYYIHRVGYTPSPIARELLSAVKELEGS